MPARIRWIVLALLAVAAPAAGQGAATEQRGDPKQILLAAGADAREHSAEIAAALRAATGQ